MASKAEALRSKRKPASDGSPMDEQNAQDAINQDYAPDTSKPDVNANTDDEGNPIASKDTIHLGTQYSDQKYQDAEAANNQKNMDSMTPTEKADMERFTKYMLGKARKAKGK
jgi:hypothetical protein